MLCITVSQSGGAESLAVVVYHHGTEDNLIASIPIDITNGEVVESVAKPWTAAIVGVPAPALSQLVGVGIYIEGTHLVAGVATASKKDAGLASVEIRCTEIVFGRAVSGIVLSPNGGIVTFITLETWKRICHRGVNR